MPFEFARRLHEKMRGEKLRGWFAPEDMQGGQKLIEQIDRAIQINDRLLLVRCSSSEMRRPSVKACRELSSGIDSLAMNAAQALKLEIDRTPEPLLQEVYDFLVFLKSRPNGWDGPNVALARDAVSVAAPDFLARQKAIFGGRTVPDSQPILDDLRADRA
ncbi:MAG: hypothetical protein ACKV2Q_01795 [Planctomycetaceae bacterium]